MNAIYLPIKYIIVLDIIMSYQVTDCMWIWRNCLYWKYTCTIEIWIDMQRMLIDLNKIICFIQNY